jgi:hypothetical protein
MMVSAPSSPAWLGLFFVALFLMTTEAQAQSKAPARTPSSARASSGKKVIKLDTLTVEGRIQKPEAFYVLPRSNLSFDELSKPESFVPQIEKSAQKDPF